MRPLSRSATRGALLLPLALLAAACERGPAEIPPEVVEARQAARSRACLTAEIARTAESNVQELESSFAGLGEGPAAEFTRRAAAAATEYARAFRQHAELREIAAAHADSALNHAAGAEDSLRHVRRSEQVTIVLPQPGTLEGNVIESYERELAALVADEDHPCNWNLDG